MNIYIRVYLFYVIKIINFLRRGKAAYMKKTSLAIIYFVISLFFINSIFSCSNESNGSEEIRPEPVVKYTVTFYSNSDEASGNTEGIIAEADSTIVLTKNGFSLTGFSFIGWNTEADGSGTGYSDEASIKLSSNLVLYAQWLSDIIPKYKVEINPTEHGIVSVNKTIAEAGTEISITVTPDELYALDTISVKNADDSSITTKANTENSNIFTFIIGEQNVSVNVKFKYVAHSITVVAGEHGSVTVSKTEALAGDEISITMTPDELYAIDTIAVKNADGSNVTLIGNSENTNVKMFTMGEQNVSVNVTFKYIAHSISITPVENGTINLNKEIAIEGTEIIITTTPNALYIVNSIIIKDANNNPIDISISEEIENTYKFNMPDSDITICVSFKIVHLITIKNTKGIKACTVLTNKTTATAGTDIIITIIPTEVYALESIIIKDANDNSILPIESSNNGNIFTFLMPESDVTITVNMKYIAHPINYDYWLQNGKIKLSKYEALTGTEISVTVIPDEFYLLESISVTGRNSGSNIEIKQSSYDNNIYTFIMPDEKVDINVNFRYAAHEIGIFATDHGSITVSHEKAISGTEISLSLTSDEFYVVNSIAITDADRNNIEMTYDGNNYTFIMPDKDVVIEVIFSGIPYTVTFMNTDGITVYKTQNIERNKNATKISPPEASYFYTDFICWCTDINCSNVFDFNTPITENIILYPKWKKFWASDDKIVSIISELRYSCWVVGYNQFNLDSVTNINNALRELYNTHPEIMVSLDFSESYMPIFYGYLQTDGGDNLENIILPKGVTGVNFDNWHNLKSIILAEGVRSVTFKQCNSLLSLEIPSSVRVIQPCAFEGCTALTDIIFKDTESKWKYRNTVYVMSATDTQNNATLLKTNTNASWEKIVE